MAILGDFAISNFFLSDLLTDSLTVTRPRGAFAPKNKIVPATVLVTNGRGKALSYRFFLQLKME